MEQRRGLAIHWIWNAWGLLLCVLLGLPMTASAAVAEVAPPSLALADLEQRLADPDEVAMAVADLEAGIAQLAQQQGEQGMKLFAGAGVGYSTDTSLAGSAKHYATYDLRAGLRYPLLGRAAAEARGVAEAETSVREREQRVELARRQALALLRRQYVAYWAAEEKLKLTESFLADERRQSELLARRRGEGYLLDADYQEMLTVFDLARRNREQLIAARTLALRTIERLTGVSGDFAAARPLLPAPCLDSEQIRHAAGEEYPAVAILRERLRGLERQASLARHAGPNANMDVYTASGNDDSLNDPEYSVGVAVGIELPAGRLLDGKQQGTKAAEAQVVKGRRELSLALEQAWMQAEEALALYQASGADLRLASQRLRAVGESLRERQLRTAMEGSTLEQLHQARSAFYQVGQDLIDAQVRGWNHQITLLDYAPGKSDIARGESLAADVARIDPELLVAPEPAAASQSVAGVNSLYVWQSARFQELAEADPGFLADLRATGIDRFLLAPDEKQIARLAEPAARQAFAGWLRRICEAGFQVELLLGEPLWILPKHRDNLLDILTALADLPFTGLHLDIEPHQLTPAQAGSIDVRKEWLATIRSARNASVWPLGVSVHPRYFETGKNGWPGFGPALAKAGVSEVILMIYASNPERVREVAAPIMQAWPALRFGVAQSVEPELAPSESHFRAGRRQFDARMGRLATSLGRPNFKGIVIQDWSRWREMKP